MYFTATRHTQKAAWTTHIVSRFKRSVLHLHAVHSVTMRTAILSDQGDMRLPPFLEIYSLHFNCRVPELRTRLNKNVVFFCSFFFNFQRIGPRDCPTRFPFDTTKDDLSSSSRVILFSGTAEAATVWIVGLYRQTRVHVGLLHTFNLSIALHVLVYRVQMPGLFLPRMRNHTVMLFVWCTIYAICWNQ